MKQICIIGIGIILALVACNRPGPGTGKLFEKRATGLPYEVVVVMENGLWKGHVGDAVYAQLTAPIPALPQSEPKMKVMHVTSDDFNGLMKYVRNVLLVDVNPKRYTRVSLQSKQDEWASGQLVQVLTAPDTTELLASLAAQQIDLTVRFDQAEQERRKVYLQQTHNSWVKEQVHTQFGATLLAPEEMTSSKTGSHFLWVSDNANRGRSDLLVYSFPWQADEPWTEAAWIARRDSVLQRNLPGSFEGSYMTTETRMPPLFTATAATDGLGGTLRGLWRMQGDMMGGPFVSRALYDAEQQRMIVVEGFVYAPESNKAPLIHKLEASLTTFRLDK